MTEKGYALTPHQRFIRLKEETDLKDAIIARLKEERDRYKKALKDIIAVTAKPRSREEVMYGDRTEPAHLMERIALDALEEEDATKN